MRYVFFSFEEVTVNQIELGEKSVKLEKRIRNGSKGDSLVDEWFRLVEEKNDLIQKENGFLLQQRELISKK